jgi:hypothetical protein
LYAATVKSPAHVSTSAIYLCPIIAANAVKPLTKDNFPALLLSLHFEQNGNQYHKKFTNSDVFLTVDDDKKLLIYPEAQGLIINERQTCNYSAAENFGIVN